MIITCATAFDRLGHGEMLQSMASCFKALYPGGVVKTYALPVIDRHAIPMANVTPVNVAGMSTFFTVENKNRIHSRLGGIGLFLFFALRFYALTRYYIKLYRSTPTKFVMIDLEFEPLQSAVARMLVPADKHSRGVSVVHSFPNGQSAGFKKFYKALSLVLIRRHVGRGNILGVMTSVDYEAALAVGIPKDQLVLVGWGLDHRAVVHEDKTIGSMDENVRFVSAGVLRKNKQIDRLIRYFAAIDDPRICLKIAGAPIDIDPDTLTRLASELPSKTSISVEARYFGNEEFSGLFRNADVVILSHDGGFQSMSGPLLTALQLRKPILCFSKHNVARIVSDLSAGIVADLDEDISEGLKTEIRLLKHRKYALPENFPYSWFSICRRLKDSISSRWPEAGLN